MLNLSRILIAFSLMAFAEIGIADRICTRDYSEGMDICAMGTSPKHRYIKPEVVGRKNICAMTYDDENCKFHKLEFAHAKSASGEIVCILNFNQPEATGNYCVIDPVHYMYANDPWL